MNAAAVAELLASSPAVTGLRWPWRAGDPSYQLAARQMLRPNGVLSCELRDEAAVARWRNIGAHRDGQARGRAGIFNDYRIRIAHVVRDYGMSDRAQAPADSRAVSLTCQFAPTLTNV